MNHFEWSWNQEGYKLYAQGWQPAETKAVVCIVHGFAEHSSRYAHVAERLGRDGIATLAFDQVGHGKSDGKRGYTPSYDFLLDTCKAILDEAETRFPGVPKFLYGHSMGGNIVLNYLLRRNPSISGAIATGPLLKLGFEPPAIKMFMAKIMRNIFPKFTEKANLDTNGLARDKEVVRAYNNDPLVHNDMTVALFFPLFENGLWAIENAASLKTKLLLMHGSADRLTSPEGSRLFAEKAPANLLTYQSLEGYYHEIHNEPAEDREKVLSTISKWILM